MRVRWFPDILSGHSNFGFSTQFSPILWKLHMYDHRPLDPGIVWCFWLKGLSLRPSSQTRLDTWARSSSSSTSRKNQLTGRGSPALPSLFRCDKCLSLTSAWDPLHNRVVSWILIMNWLKTIWVGFRMVVARHLQVRNRGDQGVFRK